MMQKSWWLTVLVTVAVVILIETFVGGYVEARLSTNQTLQRWGLVSPRAPIVITNRETVRVSDGTDLVDGFNKIKSKVATVAVQEADRLVPTGTALNWTTDGWFMTVAGSLAQPGKTYVLILFNGDVVPVTAATFDSRSSLALLKTSAKNVAITSLANTADIEVGQKLVIANGTGRAGDAAFSQTALQTKEQLGYGATTSADVTARSFSITVNAALQPGSVLATTNGDALGLWDGSRVIPAGYMKVAAMMIANGGNKTRFGFSYRFTESTEAEALGMVVGARVVQIDDKKAVAATSGLQAGDIITAVGASKIVNNTDLEIALEQLTAGTTSQWQINRAGQTVTLQVKL